MRFPSGGVELRLPPGWQVRARLQDPVRPGVRGNLLLHAATVPMPAQRGDFGSEVVDRLGPHDAFVSLLEYDRADAGTALFADQGLPVARPGDFSPGVLQRTLPGVTGAQWFFSLQGRPFCLHAVLGSHGRRVAGAAQVQRLLRGLTIRRMP